MRRIAVIAAVVITAALVPETASANCGYASSQPLHQPVGNATVYAGGSDQSGQATSSAGACVYDPAGISTDPSIVLHGTTVEAGEGANADNSPSPGVYAVADGDNTNITPLGSGDGYVGVSNWETAPSRGTCGESAGHGTDSGTGTNSGGCFAIKGFTVVQVLAAIEGLIPIPTLICGNQTGDDWYNAGRDGCLFPDNIF